MCIKCFLFIYYNAFVHDIAGPAVYLYTRVTCDVQQFNLWPHLYFVKNSVQNSKMSRLQFMYTPLLCPAVHPQHATFHSLTISDQIVGPQSAEAHA